MQLRRRIIDALGADALTLAELAARTDEPPGQVQKLLQLSPSFTRIGDRFAYLPALLDGTTWVVPIDADDAASELVPGGFVRTEPHLGIIGWWLIDSATPVHDADGRELGVLATDALLLDGIDTDILTCAPGWLDEVAGGWAAVTVHDESLTIAPVAGPPDPTAEQIAAVTAGFELALDGNLFEPDDDPFEVAMAESVVQAAVLTDREAFRHHAAPPIDRLIEAAGFEQRDRIVVRPGFDWDAFHARQRRNGLRLRYALDDAQIDLVQSLVGACELHVQDGDAALGGPSEAAGVGLYLADALTDADVATAFAGEVTSRGVTFDDLVAFAEALDRHARAAGSDRNDGVTAVLVRAHTLRGDEERATELLDAGVDSATTHPHLLHLAAELAADRGRAADARRLIARAGVTPYDPEHDHGQGPWHGPSDAQLLLDEVEPYARPRPRRDVGRNSPCPCGSGKKYKACHLGKEEVPLVDRAPWLYDKHERYVRTRVPVSLDDVTGQITDDAPEHFYDVVDAPIVIDLVLHDLAVDQDFLHRRGPLLPEDEQLLAAQWALVDRGVFEVESQRRGTDGGELRLRDLATGDVIVVSRMHLGDEIRPGMVLLGRPLPVGDTYRAFGGFWPLHRSRVNAAIDAIAAADLDALCRLMAAELRPPTLTNTDGDLMELHRITWRVAADPAAVAATLTAAGLHGPAAPDDPDAAWSLVRDSADQDDTVIATIGVARVDGGAELTFDVNSAERAEELDEFMEEWFPDAVLVDDAVLDLDELEPTSAPRVDDPAVLEVVARLIADHEQRWLDEHIPALGGRTPREAVQDPIGREEVLQLLAGFPEPEPGAPGMSPARLRTALGL